MTWESLAGVAGGGNARGGRGRGRGIPWDRYDRNGLKTGKADRWRRLDARAVAVAKDIGYQIGPVQGLQPDLRVAGGMEASAQPPAFLLLGV
jgi:hypothetical protein